MFSSYSSRVSRKHLFVCLLVLAALLGMTVAAAAHVHPGLNDHEGQCALCMSCAQMVAVCVAVVVALLLGMVKDGSFVFACESQVPSTWIPPAQRVRPPPFA